MLKQVKDFLARNWNGRSPLLLGYSGGSDSKALLYALLEAGFKLLHLAHVDHVWRPESGEEAEELKKEAEELRLPFHSIRLSARFREAESRRERLAFFRSLFEKIPFQAVVLAHHTKDVAETVLKRVLEGAHLPFLGGMQPSAQINGIPVWRPLLSVKREKILQFLEERKLKSLIDPSNFDPAYLRARMRLEIFPGLADRFGKRIDENLFLLSQRAAELKTYLRKKTERVIPFKGPWGLAGFLAGTERIEARFLLQDWGEREEIRLPRSLLEPFLDAILKKLPNLRIAPRILTDRGFVFFLSKKTPVWGNEPLFLKVGSWRWGDWMIDVKENSVPFKTDWRDVWSGNFEASAPPGWLRLPPLGTPLRYLWNEKKIPAFFRYQVPIVWREERGAIEFLTGKILPEMDSSFKLTISNLSGTTL